MKFNDFTYGGAEALKELDKTDIPDNIIIDLRDNTGGMVSVCDALIERLSDKNIEYKAEVYITPDSNYDGSGYTDQRQRICLLKRNSNIFIQIFEMKALRGKANGHIMFMLLFRTIHYQRQTDLHL